MDDRGPRSSSLMPWVDLLGVVMPSLLLGVPTAVPDALADTGTSAVHSASLLVESPSASSPSALGLSSPHSLAPFPAPTQLSPRSAHLLATDALPPPAPPVGDASSDESAAPDALYGGSIDKEGIVATKFLNEAVRRIEEQGPLGYVYFVLLYTVAEIFAVPAIPLTASAGYLFGIVPGTITVCIAATMAASVSFLLGRTLLRPRVKEFFAENPKFRAVDKVVEKEGFKMIFLLRLSPFLPFAISNYLYSLTSVKFVDYALASLLGFIPGTLAYVYSGVLGRSLVSSVGGEKIPYLVPGLVLVGLFAFLKVVSDLSNAAIREYQEELGEEAFDTLSDSDRGGGKPDKSGAGERWDLSRLWGPPGGSDEGPTTPSPSAREKSRAK